MRNVVLLSVDAETNGLWGQAFSIGAVVVSGANTVATFVGRCPIEGEVDEFVKEHVLPQMEGISETHETYESLLEDFFEWRQGILVKYQATEIVHMGFPVEARVYYDAHQMGLYGDFEGPYPLVDISAVPEIGTSVDSYCAEKGITPDCNEFAGGTHNPLYDSIAAARAYTYWLETR